MQVNGQGTKVKQSLSAWRWLYKGLIILALLSVLFTFEYTLPDWRPANLPPPAQQAFPANAQLFYFQSLPTWGKLTIDGKSLTEPPTLNSNKPVPLLPGQHTLTWTAEPFQTIHCTLTVASKTSSSCALRSVKTAVSQQHPAFVVQLPNTLAQLPSNERTALIKTIQQALDSRQSHETLEAGAHYAFSGSGLPIYTAQEAVNASQSFILHTDDALLTSCNGLSLGQGCMMQRQNCRDLCPFDNWPLTDQPQSQWHVAALFHVERTYTTARGRPLQPPPTFRAEHEDQFLALLISWQHGTWQVGFHTQDESSFDDPACTTLVSTIYVNPEYKPMRAYNWTFTSHTQGGDAGCLAIGYETGSPDLSLSNPHTIAFLERYGVVSAINAPAQKLMPTLTRPDSQELKLARELQVKAHI